MILVFSLIRVYLIRYRMMKQVNFDTIGFETGVWIFIKKLRFQDRLLMLLQKS